MVLKTMFLGTGVGEKNDARPKLHRIPPAAPDFNVAAERSYGACKVVRNK